MGMPFCSKQGEPRPRDGPWSWVICSVGFTINVVYFGFILSFGVLLPVLSDHFGESKGTTAWVGSLAIGLTFSLGLLSVKLSSYFGHRLVSICGGLVCILSLVISSFVQHMTVLFFSYGLLFGIGGGCIVNTEVMVINRYFKKKLALAVGIGSSGVSLGVMAGGPTLQALVDGFGWRGALRVMAGVMFSICLLSLTYDPNVQQDTDVSPNGATVQEQKSTGKKNKESLDCSVWVNPSYTIGTIAIFLTAFGFYTPLIHMVKFANDLSISSSKASRLFIYYGISSTVARFINGQVMNRRWLTPVSSVQLSAVAMGTSIILFTQATLYSHFVVFVVFYGLACGCFSTAEVLFFLTCLGPRKAAMGFSIGLMVSSVAICGGPMAAGFIADQMGSYIPSFYIVGGTVLLASVLPLILHCFTFGKTRNETENDVMWESQMTLIGSRLANGGSSLYVDGSTLAIV